MKDAALPRDPAKFWNDRYADAELAYGEAPNDFLREQAPLVGAGPVLCLAAGQGRNALFLAARGHAVTAVDRSDVGLQRAATLAEQAGLPLETVCADLAGYDLGQAAWGTVVSTFAHLPPELRRHVHAGVVHALQPGGHLILEAYHPRQLKFGTGGPKSEEMLMTLEALREELQGLEFVIAREGERMIREGRYHNGRSAVVQVLARKPAAA